MSTRSYIKLHSVCRYKDSMQQIIKITIIIIYNNSNNNDNEKKANYRKAKMISLNLTTKV